MKPPRRNNPSIIHDKNVYLPQKKKTQVPTRTRKKENIFSKIFPKKQKGQTRPRKRLNISGTFIILILVVVAILLIYLSITYIKSMRSGGSDTYVEIPVVGLNDIPCYPNSEFIFEDNMNEDSVINFISKGYSAYRLPLKTDFNDVISFYNEQLPNKGWTFIQSVSIGSEEKKYGEYWIKDNKGLRMYSKFNDIWYESITKEEAENGLSALVQQEAERDLLLADNESEDLLPDFPWLLKVPKEYVISYSVATFNNMKQVEFRKLGTEERISIVPIGKTGNAYDTLLDGYIETLETQTELEWGINNTIVIGTNLGTGLKGTIREPNSTHEIIVIPNSYNNVVYILDSNTVENTFMSYILDNIKVQNSITY